MVTSAPSSRAERELLGRAAGRQHPGAERRRRAGWRRCRSRRPRRGPGRRRPSRSPATIITLDQTVAATSGSAAAVTRSTPVGHRHHLAGGHRDPGRVAAAGQQGAHLVADLEPLDAAPTAATVPLHSRPSIVGGARAAAGSGPAAAAGRRGSPRSRRRRGAPRPARPRGRAPRRTPAPPGRPAPGRRRHSPLSVVVLVAACGRHPLSSGTSSSTSTGSGAPDGWSQFSARAWACAARRSISSTSASLLPAAYPRRYVVIGAALPDHVVGRHLRQVEDQRLVDLGLDVEDIAQLVDPVVEVHGPNLANAGRSFKSGASWRGSVADAQPGEVLPGVDVVAPRPRRRHVDGPPAPISRRIGTPSASPGAGTSDAPHDARELAPPSSSTSQAPSRRPSAASSSRATVAGGRRGACRRPAPRPRRGVPASAATPGGQPGQRPAARRRPRG